MAFDSFRDFLMALEKAGELTRIAPPIATELEITELADREMKQPGGGRALLIEQPTVNGQVAPFPVAINVFGSHRRMAMSLGASSVEAAAAELGSLMKAKPPLGLRAAIKLLGTALDLRHARPKMVKHGPCKEVVHKFDPVPAVKAWPREGLPSNPPGSLSSPSVSPPRAWPTLLNLPIQKCWPLDGGRFITLPGVVTRDADTGERNVGMYRLQICPMAWTSFCWPVICASNRSSW